MNFLVPSISPVLIAISHFWISQRPNVGIESFALLAEPGNVHFLDHGIVERSVQHHVAVLRHPDSLGAPQYLL